MQIFPIAEQSSNLCKSAAIVQSFFLQQTFWLTIEEKQSIVTDNIKDASLMLKCPN